ncbi:MAG: hypothetical protein CML12_03205 [Puniceicoccaceae bacterium]|nr:hypothetical protein [Puniceicoccaceae bacterium]RCL31343.1 MAG: hypothetical protein DBX03_01065 [Puniceicoccaceae bacterium]
MKELNEKLIIAIAGVLLLAGLAFYVLFPSEKSPMTEEPTSVKAYDSIALPTSVTVNADWPEAQEQAKGELYDLFTPPEIYVNSRGEFVFRTPYFVSSDDPFGIELVDVVRNPYRFQLDGFVEEDRSDSSKTTILIHSVADGRSLRMSPQSTNEEYGIELLDWSVSTNSDLDENTRVVARLKLRDSITNRIVNLRHDQNLYEEKISVLFAVEGTNEQYILDGVNTSFFIDDIEYRLDAIDVENQTVLVTKLIPDNDPITELLLIQSPEEASEEEMDTDSSSFEDAFDSFF